MDTIPSGLHPHVDCERRLTRVALMLDAAYVPDEGAVDERVEVALRKLDRLQNAVEALLDVTFDAREATAEFDRIGYAYFMETGFQRPGKDDREYDTSSQENRIRFSEWMRDRTGKAIDLAREALGLVEVRP